MLRINRIFRSNALLLALASALLPIPAVAEDTFSFQPPASLDQDRRLNLWSTYYYVSAAQGLPPEDPFKLLSKQGKALGASLAARDWCNAAVEGTVSIRSTADMARTFNYAGRGTSQVDCLRYFPSLGANIGKSLFRQVPADAPFGLGDTSKYKLVPYRSIAVDRSQPAFRMMTGSQLRKVAVFIPSLRGVKIKLPNGQMREHDGYVYAADTGGAIKGNHIDFFLGTEHKNPAANLILSKATPTFAAYLVDSEEIREALYKLHERSSP